MSTVDELMAGARDRLLRGDLAGARELVETVADRWRTTGNVAEEARCRRLAAALARHEGRPVDALAEATRAVAVAPGAAGYAEVGRAALATGDPAAAIAAYEAALADPGELRAGLEAGYAGALLAGGRAPDAFAAWRRAIAALAGEPALAGQSTVDGVAQLQAAGHPDLAERLSEEFGPVVDHPAASGLALLAAARAVDRADLSSATEHAQRARTEALAGRSPGGYIAAAGALAAIADTTGDRVAAYRSLAVGWVTLADLVGPEAARDAFAPQLIALRDAWGPAEFAAVKASYEAGR